MRLVLLAAVLSSLTPAATAQTTPQPGSCMLGTAQTDLAAGNVIARVFNTGSLFYGNDSASAYVVPRNSGRSPLYAAGLWVGGRVGGELRVAGGTYGGTGLGFTFWPGPLGSDARPVNPADCSAYDRLYSVSRADIAAYETSGTASTDLAEWPAALGAPVRDGDGTPGNYNLAGGDRPDIVGDAAVWWVMNDVGNAHTDLQTAPLGIEVRVLAFAFDRPGALGDATFYRYTLVNKSGADVTEAYVSLFADPDLGDASDDYVGVDSARAMAFVYNADNEDGTGAGSTYGTPPPAVGFDLLQGPVVPAGAGSVPDTLGITAFLSFKNAPGRSDPATGVELYNNQRGLWTDGTTMRDIGNGYQQTQGTVTTLQYSGDPVTGQPWSEVNTGAGASAAGDRHVALSAGPFTLAASASQEIVVGVLFGQGATNLASVTALRAASDAVQAAFRGGFAVASEAPAATATRLLTAVPNPSSGAVRVALVLAEASDATVAVFDALGRQVALLHEGAAIGTVEASFDGRTLPAGVYVVRAVVRGATGAAVLTRTVTIAR